MYIACVTVTAMFREGKYVYEYEYVGEKKSDTLCTDRGIRTQCSYRGRCAGNHQISDRELPDNPAIPLLDKCPKELKANTKIDICTPMFTAALVTTAKREQQQSVYRYVDVSKMHTDHSLLMCIKEGTFIFLHLCTLHLYAYVHTHLCYDTHVEVRGQSAGVNSPLSP